MKKSLIIIPTYNEKENVHKIIPEVLAQDPGFNVLIVDDNSPDGTASLVKEMQKEDDRIHLLAKTDECDLVIGSRYIAGVNVVNWPMRRLILSYSANLYTRLITGLPVRDATAGFKCYKRKVLENIDLDSIRSNGYSFQIETNFKAWKKGFRLCEVPIIFIDRLAGTSKMSKNIVYEAAWMVWKLKLKSIFSKGGR
jgi:dolichol-phosphate mannosyltransferase